MEQFFRKKAIPPLGSTEETGEPLKRNYSTLDLLCLGIGGTVGAGIFVLSGLVANRIAGPLTPICWLVAGIAAILSACSYAELSVRLPNSGSSYNYVFATMGELPAFASAFFLSLEFGVSASALSRSWGDKVQDWLIEGFGVIPGLLSPGGLNIMAACIMIVCVLIVLSGVQESKLVTNVLTFFKMTLVAFMCIAAFILFDRENLSLTPEVSSSSTSENQGGMTFGMGSVFRGATACFFGYIGYDEVCCLAGEAKNPVKSLPYAVFGTIILCTVIYTITALSLVGMTNYQNINQDSGFASGFKDRGWIVTYHITYAGELLTLPLSILVSFIGQPRVLLAMAQDRLCPKIFSEVDHRGNLTQSVRIAGTVCVLLAMLVPFIYLESMVSAGILINFNMTNTALIIMRSSEATTTGCSAAMEVSPDNWLWLHRWAAETTNHTALVVFFHLGAIVVSFILATLVSDKNYSTGFIVLGSLLVTFGGIALMIIALLLWKFPKKGSPKEDNADKCPRCLLGGQGNEIKNGANAVVSAMHTTEDDSDDEEMIDFMDAFGGGESQSIAGRVTQVVKADTIEARNRSKEADRRALLLSQQFRIWGVPFLPLLAIFVNYFLLAQLPWSGLGYLLVYIVLCLSSYFGMFYLTHHHGYDDLFSATGSTDSGGTTDPIVSNMHIGKVSTDRESRTSIAQPTSCNSLVRTSADGELAVSLSSSMSENSDDSEEDYDSNNDSLAPNSPMKTGNSMFVSMPSRQKRRGSKYVTLAPLSKRYSLTGVGTKDSNL